MACVLLGYNVVSHHRRTEASSHITLPLINNNICFFIFYCSCCKWTGDCLLQTQWRIVSSEWHLVTYSSKM